MKIVHITTHISGGAGSFAYNIYKAGLKKNNKTNFIVSTETVKLNKLSSIYLSLIYRVHDLIYAMLNFLNFLEYKHLFFSLFPTYPFKNNFVFLGVDIFLIYWVSRFFDTESLKQLKIKNPEAKFIFLLTDEAPLTGGCHYKFDCKNHENSCEKCPGMNLKFLQKKVSKEYGSKRDLYKLLKPKFIFPSSTYLNDFKNSVLLDNYDYSATPYGAFFKEELDNFFKKRKLFLEINNCKINILIRSSKEPRKGCDFFLDIIKKMNSKHPSIADKIKLHIIGDEFLTNNGIAQLMDTSYHGIVTREQLFELYAKMDTLLITSEEDAGPIMINEACGIGLYVISSKVGVASDLINGENGQIYNQNTEELIEILDKLKLKTVREYANNFINSDHKYRLSFENFYEKIIHQQN